MMTFVALSMYRSCNARTVRFCTLSDVLPKYMTENLGAASAYITSLGLVTPANLSLSASAI